ncbi:chemotaxis protein CheW [Pelobacter seleniigenes]|uniref:chemotaxis protein CheW n=1 Tax=Pelobacter seleniigenes TaxID=407188 RepID=UPI0004A6DD5C|nr:chemotaxis protein CheW [Pelobacter seleniigenes]
MEKANLIDANQYLTFKLGDEEFGLTIAKVREVLDFTSLTKVPQTPDYMCGVLNLRGSVVPVVDLKLKFGLQQTARTVNTCIIIVEIEIDGEVTVLGILADAVHEVVEIDAEQVEPAPKIGTRLDTAFIQGMGKLEDDFVVILDIDKVFSLDEIAGVRAA